MATKTHYPAISRNPRALHFAARIVCAWAELPEPERELERAELVMALEMRETREIAWQARRERAAGKVPVDTERE